MSDLISRQAAIEQIEAIFPVDPHANECAEGVAIGAALAKQFISTLPSAQPESAKRTAEAEQNVSDSDLISRKAAIDAFDGVKVDEENCTEYDIGYNDGIDFAVSRLSVLPSAQPYTDEEIQKMQDIEQAQLDKAYEMGKADALRWIPCSERLPEKNCRCLTTNTAWGAFEVDFNVWINGEWLYPNEKPIAWMPMPEPYREDDK